MTKIFIAITGLFLSVGILQAQTDTMYVMKAGLVINKQSIKLADVDSIIFYNPVNNTVTDIDGNVYKTIKIGTQTWMAENLKTTKYNDGTTIPYITNGTAWSISTPAYCWYNNVATNINTYGALYNWYTINTAKLAPAGWHIPTDAEWTTLENYVNTNLGSYGSVAKALAANAYWESSTNTGAIGNDLTKNNGFSFSALPAGCRFIDNGTFSSLGSYGGWWTATESSSGCAWERHMYYYSSNIHKDGMYGKSYGFSVRCVKD